MGHYNVVGGLVVRPVMGSVSRLFILASQKLVRGGAVSFPKEVAECHTMQPEQQLNP